MKSIIVFIIVTIIAFAFGIFAGANSVEIWNNSAFFLCVVLAMVINWVAFLPSTAAP